MKNKNQLIDILGDTANFKELIISMIISAVFGLIGYSICPYKAPHPLFWGLIGLIIAFIITNILFKPKRKIIYKKGEQND